MKEIYHKTLFLKTLGKKKYSRPYLLPYFNPSEYGFRFDGFANSLALELHFLSDKKGELMGYVRRNHASSSKYLLPSFYPAITKTDKEWIELEDNFSVVFRNRPHEYHNGGLWPMITGFYASALSRFDLKEAGRYLDWINFANSLNNWSFPEFLNSRTFKTGEKNIRHGALQDVF